MGVLIIEKALLTAYVLGNTFIVPRIAITSNVFQVFRKPFSVYMFKSFYLKIIMAGLKKTSSFQNSDNDNKKNKVVFKKKPSSSSKTA